MFKSASVFILHIVALGPSSVGAVQMAGAADVLVHRASDLLLDAKTQGAFMQSLATEIKKTAPRLKSGGQKAEATYLLPGVCGGTWIGVRTVVRMPLCACWPSPRNQMRRK